MGPLQHVEIAVHPLVARPLRDRDRGVVDDVHEAGRIALRGHIHAALFVGGRDEPQLRMRQPVLLNGREAVADLVGYCGVGIADDLPQGFDGGDLTTHGFIMLA